ncbi:MAG TPA: hypothetical protein VE152_04725, partial [Acidimicrobiales bacterium]|nr:hypothetical protein [Acidimicrobiales bacterium]
MAGLSFDEGDTPDPESPLVTWLLEWVEAVGKLAPKTVAGYVSDLAGLGAELAGVVDKALPEVYSDPAALAAASSDPAVSGLAAAYGCRAGSFVRARAILGRLVLADLHPRYVARAVNRYAASHRPTSTRRAASALSSYCRYLVGQQVLAANPMASPAVEVPAAKPGDPVPLSYAEAERVVAVCGQVDPRARAPWPARDLAAYAVFVATGVRLDEAIAAAVGDLFDEPDAGARLRVWGKGSKPRTIPVHAEAGALVRAYLDERPARVGRYGA